MLNDIYIITWTGRDPDSEIWDEYPVYRMGYFTDPKEAQKRVEELNKDFPGEYDEEAEAEEKYDFRAIQRAKPKGNKNA